jgi:hypothetical protein
MGTALEFGEGWLYVLPGTAKVIVEEEQPLDFQAAR